MRIEHEHWNVKQIVRTHVMEIHRSQLILPMEGGRGNSWLQFPARIRILADWQFHFIPAQWCQCPVWRGGGLPHWHGMDSFNTTLMWGVFHDFPNVFHSPHPIGCSVLPRDIQSEDSRGRYKFSRCVISRSEKRSFVFLYVLQLLLSDISILSWDLVAGVNNIWIFKGKLWCMLQYCVNSRYTSIML